MFKDLKSLFNRNQSTFFKVVIIGLIAGVFLTVRGLLPASVTKYFSKNYFSSKNSGGALDA